MAKSEKNPPPISTANWIFTLVVTSIPLVNIVTILYWALAPWANPNKRNFCRALLFLFLFSIFALIVFIAIGAVGPPDWLQEFYPPRDGAPELPAGVSDGPE